MTAVEIALLSFIVILVLLPPSYDPAIRIKEWNEGWATKLRHRNRVCARKGHAWLHVGGRNAGCSPDCQCSVPVRQCAGCGDCDYGDNWEAIHRVAECPIFAEWQERQMTP